MLWLVAFVWTLAIELPIYTIALSRHVRSWQRLCGLVLLVNAISHPLLWFGFLRFESYAAYVITGELCVVAIEAILLGIAIKHWRLALVSSVCANAISTLLGLPLMRLF